MGDNWKLRSSLVLVYLAFDILTTCIFLQYDHRCLFSLQETLSENISATFQLVDPVRNDYDLLICAAIRWFTFLLVFIGVIVALAKDRFIFNLHSQDRYCTFLYNFQVVVAGVVLFEIMWFGVKILFKESAHDTILQQNGTSANETVGPGNIIEWEEYTNMWFWLLYGFGFVNVIMYLALWRMFVGRAIELKREAFKLKREKARRRLSQCLEKDADLDNIDLKNVTVWRILQYSLPDWGVISGAVFFLLVAAVGEAYLPYLLGLVITNVLEDNDSYDIIRALGTILAIAGVTAVASGARGGLFHLSMARINMRMRDVMYNSVLHQDVAFFDIVKCGDLLSRLATDITIMSDAITLNANVFVRSALKTVIKLVLMWQASWQLTVLTLIVVPFVVSLSEFYGRFYKKLQVAVQNRCAYCNEAAEEVFSSIKTVKSFAAEDLERKRYYARLLNIYKINKMQAWVYGGFQIFTTAFVILLPNLAIWYVYMIDKVSFEQIRHKFLSFLFLQQTICENFNEIVTVYTGLMKAIGAADKVMEYIDRVPKRPKYGSYKPKTLQGKIEIRNVSLTYASRPNRQILKGLNVTIEPGTITALVGPSGGGKSTTISLVENFYQPDSGDVLIDGVSVKDYDHKFLHEKVALVGQEPTLYARSIRENIQYGVENKVNFDDVIDSAKKANAHDFICETTDEYGTFCGEKGAQMSGGQKQRIAIARALVRNPKILLLDEATSALDTESEHLVQQALEKNLKDRTVLVIAHRLSTVERADKIIVIQKGHAVEEGTHLQLMTKPNSAYRKLVQRQLMPEEMVRGERRGSDDDGMPVEDRLTSSFSDHPRYVPITVPQKNPMPGAASVTAKLGNVCRIASSFVAEQDRLGFPRRGTTEYSQPEYDVAEYSEPASFDALLTSIEANDEVI